jgi:hypothetical protein
MAPRRGRKDIHCPRHAPDKWRGEFRGHHIAHGKPPIPVTVHLERVDSGEGELDGWTSQ